MSYRTLVSSIMVMAFLSVWEIAPRVGIVDATYTSQPTRVIRAGLESFRIQHWSIAKRV